MYILYIYVCNNNNKEKDVRKLKRSDKYNEGSGKDIKRSGGRKQNKIM